MKFRCVCFLVVLFVLQGCLTPDSAPKGHGVGYTGKPRELYVILTGDQLPSGTDTSEAIKKPFSLEPATAEQLSSNPLAGGITDFGATQWLNFIDEKEFSIAVWASAATDLKRSSAFSGNALLSNVDNAAPDAGPQGFEMLRLSNGNFAVYAGTGAIFDSGLPFPLGTFAHVVVTRRGNSVHLYVNGVKGKFFSSKYLDPLGGARSASLSTAGRGSKLTALFAGRAGANPGACTSGSAFRCLDSWKGSIASVELYQTALDDSKVAELYGLRHQPVPSVLSGKWVETSVKEAPSPRARHCGVFSGNKMYVFGGRDRTATGDNLNLRDGGVFDPISNSWTLLPEEGAPQSFANNCAASAERIILFDGQIALLDTTTQTWRRGSVPPFEIKKPSTVVYAGYEKVLVWYNGNEKAGGIYDIATDTWARMSTENAPSPRSAYASVFTGKYLFVWGGTIFESPDNKLSLADGARYDVDANRWESVNPAAGMEGRRLPQLIWTGAKVLLIGGNSFDVQRQAYHPVHPLYELEPVSLAWKRVDLPKNVLPGGMRSVVWTGQRYLLWGGTPDSRASSGYSFEPGKGEWKELTKQGAPSDRYLHSAVWTGDRMVIWGGSLYGDTEETSNDGAMYFP